MKLFHRVILTLSLGLLPVMALWSVLFYYGMVNEINDETDDVLTDYAVLIIRRALAGKPLPEPNSGSNNSYSITAVDEEYAKTAPHMVFYDEMVYIPEKEETEPARVLKTIYNDAQGLYYELTVATPTFERADLLETVAYHIVTLYVVLMLTIFVVVSLVYYYNMRPLYRLLQWFDEYSPGLGKVSVPVESSVVEFRKLIDAARQAVNRAEYYFEQQKQFIPLTMWITDGGADENAALPVAPCAVEQDAVVALENRERPVPRFHRGGCSLAAARQRRTVWRYIRGAWHCLLARHPRAAACADERLACFDPHYQSVEKCFCA